MSQVALAETMTARGHGWSQATVWSTEKGRRALKLNEAIDLADIFNVTLDAFNDRNTEKAQHEIARKEMNIKASEHADTWENVAEVVAKYLNSRDDLRFAIHNETASGRPDVAQAGMFSYRFHTLWRALTHATGQFLMENEAADDNNTAHHTGVSVYPDAVTYMNPTDYVKKYYFSSDTEDRPKPDFRLWEEMLTPKAVSPEQEE